MVTLNNVVALKIKHIKQFSCNMQEAKKSSEQKKIDARFSEIIRDVHSCVKQVCSAVNYSEFQCTENIKEKLKHLLSESEDIIKKQQVSSQKNADLVRELKKIQQELDSQWQEYFVKETSSINEILKLAQNISSIDVERLRNDIRSAASWSENNDVKKIENFMKSLEAAKQVINNLELNEDILNFLKKMVNYTATISDLSEEILEWIKKEKLEKRVKISFLVLQNKN